MAQYDDKLNRMLNLMEDDRKSKNIYEGNVWYHANGADGKVYGILKEGTKFYIKTTESGKENISESYDYINGFTNRREHEYSSYNDATKHLEQELMYLNEQFGKHEPTSTVDFKRTEKSFAFLTEESRKELENGNVYVQTIMVDGGRQLKRIRTAPQGRAARIRKRSNHVTVIVGTKNVKPAEEPAKEA